MRSCRTMAAVALVVLTGCAMAPTAPSGTLRTQQYGGSPTYSYGPQLALIAVAPARYITPRGAMTDQPGRRNDVDILGLQVQNNRIVIQSRDGRTLVGYTHPHGPDLGFAIDMPDGDTLEGIVHTRAGAHEVTLAYVTNHGRVFSGRQAFAPAPQVLVRQDFTPAPPVYGRPY